MSFASHEEKQRYFKCLFEYTMSILCVKQRKGINIQI